MELNSIRVCRNHEEIVPLIWTFAFPGAEYWCPYCGHTHGMLGAGKFVDSTIPILRSAVLWKQKGAEYLTAMSTLNCDELKWEGKYIKPSELPKEEIERCQKIVKDWEYEGS